jgi:amino acid transporter
VIAKLLPIAVLIAVGLWHAGSGASVHFVPSGTTYGAGAWFGAILLGVFSFGGFEDPLAATGDVNKPRSSIAFALGMSLMACIVVYTLVQFVVVGALGNGVSERPLAAAASVWLGPGGGALVAATAMLSTAGSISAIVLAAPRILAALGENGDAPRVFARVSGATGAPVVASGAVAFLILTLAITGTFPLALAITAGSMMVMIIGVCAALPRLRVLHPSADAMRIPFGRSLAAIGIGLSVVLLAQLNAREAALVGVTASFAALNWVLVRRGQFIAVGCIHD